MAHLGCSLALMTLGWLTWNWKRWEQWYKTPEMAWPCFQAKLAFRAGLKQWKHAWISDGIKTRGKEGRKNEKLKQVPQVRGASGHNMKGHKRETWVKPTVAHKSETQLWREEPRKRQGCVTWQEQAFQWATVKCCQLVIIANESMCLFLLSSETVAWIFFSFSTWHHTHARPHTCPFWTKRK